MDQLNQQFSKMESTLVDLKAEKELYEAKHCAVDQETIMLQKDLHELELELRSQQFNLHNRSFLSRELTEIKTYCYQTQDLTRKWANSFNEITDYCMKNLDSMVFIDPQFENNADEIELLRVNLEETILKNVGGSLDDMDRIKRMSEDLMYTVEAEAAKDLQNEKEELDLLTKHLVNNENLLRFGVLDRELEIPAFNFTLKNVVLSNAELGEKTLDNEAQRTPPMASKNVENEAIKTPPSAYKKFHHRKGSKSSNHISEDELHQHEIRGYSGNSFEQDNSNQEIQDQKRKRTIETINEIIDETSQNKKTRQEPMTPQSKGTQDPLDNMDFFDMGDMEEPIKTAFG
uniref:Uncharacterized protein n=1 Tax=Tetranychus urticae TaxID=32264 RepID=T1KIS2_TETUR